MPVVIVGAGAAGMIAAIFAARAGVSVVIAETRPTPGAKIRVSGGGRCNILPSVATLEDFHTDGSSRAMRNILFSWPLDRVHAFFEEDLGIPLKVEPTGKVFPRSDQSRDVVSALLRELRASGATLAAPCRVVEARCLEDGGFELISSNGDRMRARRLVLATGGLSLPKSGSDGGGLTLAAALGHGRTPTYPALVSLRSSCSRWKELSGVSVPARITVERAGRVHDELEGDFLFTHRGFSGPVVLDASRHVTRGDEDVTLRVRWGGRGVEDWDTILRKGGSATVGSALRKHLPNRLAAMLVSLAEVDDVWRLSELKRVARLRLTRVLDRFELPVSGSEGYAVAEVTGGGIPLEEVRVSTLESRVVPGLYFCGEMLDVTGRLGGYNFLWAWVTGRKVGMALAAGDGAEDVPAAP